MTYSPDASTLDLSSFILVCNIDFFFFFFENKISLLYHVCLTVKH